VSVCALSVGTTKEICHFEIKLETHRKICIYEINIMALKSENRFFRMTFGQHVESIMR
jgi:hypothetical protein